MPSFLSRQPPMLLFSERRGKIVDIRLNTLNIDETKSAITKSKSRMRCSLCRSHCETDALRSVCDRFAFSLKMQPSNRLIFKNKKRRVFRFAFCRQLSRHEDHRRGGARLSLITILRKRRKHSGKRDQQSKFSGQSTSTWVGEGSFIPQRIKRRLPPGESAERDPRRRVAL